MNNMAVLRDYLDADYDEVRKNLEEANMYADALDTRENLEQKIRRNPGSIIIAVDNDMVVGSVYFVEDGWMSFIARLNVREEYRNKGIGNMLMDEAEARLRQRGVKEASLCARVADLDRLEEFYHNRGYIDMKGRHQWMYKEL